MTNRQSLSLAASLVLGALSLALATPGQRRLVG